MPPVDDDRVARGREADRERYRLTPWSGDDLPKLLGPLLALGVLALLALVIAYRSHRGG